MKIAGPGVVVAFLLLVQSEVVNAFGVYAKGTITGKLLNLSSVSNYELAMNLNPSPDPANGPSSPPELLSFKVDGRDLSRPEFHPLAVRLGIPAAFITAVSGIDVSELKARKKITRPVYAGLQVDLVYKDETTKDMTADISGDGTEITEIVLPRPWLIGQLVVRVEARHRVRGSLTYDLAGTLQKGTVTWEILVEPTLQKAAGKKEEKPEEKKGQVPPAPAEPPQKPEEPPRQPEPPPGTSPQVPEQPRSLLLRPSYRDAFRENAMAGSRSARDPGWTISTGANRGWSGSFTGSPLEAEPPPPPEPGPPAPSPTEPAPSQPPPAPPGPVQPPEAPKPPNAPEKEARGADLNLLARFGFSYSLKVDFEIQKDPLPKNAGSPSEQ